MCTLLLNRKKLLILLLVFLLYLSCDNKKEKLEVDNINTLKSYLIFSSFLDQNSQILLVGLKDSALPGEKIRIKNKEKVILGETLSTKNGSFSIKIKSKIDDLLIIENILLNANVGNTLSLKIPDNTSFTLDISSVTIVSHEVGEAIITSSKGFIPLGYNIFITNMTKHETSIFSPLSDGSIKANINGDKGDEIAIFANKFYEDKIVATSPIYLKIPPVTPLPKPDEAPPYVISSTPSNNEENVLPKITVNVLFSEPILKESLNKESFILQEEESESIVIGDIELSKDYKSAILTPYSSLKFGTLYIVKLTDKIYDLSSNPLIPYQFTFKTIDYSNNAIFIDNEQKEIIFYNLSKLPIEISDNPLEISDIFDVKFISSLNKIIIAKKTGEIIFVDTSQLISPKITTKKSVVPHDLNLEKSSTNKINDIKIILLENELYAYILLKGRVQTETIPPKIKEIGRIYKIDISKEELVFEDKEINPFSSSEIIVTYYNNKIIALGGTFIESENEGTIVNGVIIFDTQTDEEITINRQGENIKFPQATQAITFDDISFLPSDFIIDSLENIYISFNSKEEDSATIKVANLTNLNVLKEEANFECKIDKIGIDEKNKKLLIYKRSLEDTKFIFLNLPLIEGLSSYEEVSLPFTLQKPTLEISYNLDLAILSGSIKDKGSIIVNLKSKEIKELDIKKSKLDLSGTKLVGFQKEEDIYKLTFFNLIYFTNLNFLELPQNNEFIDKEIFFDSKKIKGVIFQYLKDSSFLSFINIINQNYQELVDFVHKNKKTIPLPSPKLGESFLAISPDGNIAILGSSEDSFLDLIDLLQVKLIKSLNSPIGGVDKGVISSDNKKAFLLNRKENKVGFIDLEKGLKLGDIIELEEGSYDIAYAEKEDIFILGDGKKGIITFIDPNSFKSISSISLEGDYPLKIFLSVTPTSSIFAPELNISGSAIIKITSSLVNSFSIVDIKKEKEIFYANLSSDKVIDSIFPVSVSNSDITTILSSKESLYKLFADFQGGITSSFILEESELLFPFEKSGNGFIGDRIGKDNFFIIDKGLGYSFAIDYNGDNITAIFHSTKEYISNAYIPFQFLPKVVAISH